MIGAGQHVNHPCWHEGAWPNSLVLRPPWLYTSSVKNKTKNKLCMMYFDQTHVLFRLYMVLTYRWLLCLCQGKCHEAKKMTQWTHRAGHDSRLILKACSTLGAMQRLMTLENDGKLLFEICSYAYFQLYLHGEVQCFKSWLSRPNAQMDEHFTTKTRFSVFGKKN